VIYLSGVVRPDLPAMITPRMGQKPSPGQPWAADNGRFSKPQDYTDAKYLAWLRRMPVESCLFATAPDVVGDAQATLDMSRPMLPQIRALGYKAGLVAQDGLEALDVPWDEFDCLFVGGTTEWKLSEHAFLLVQEAKRRGKWTHMGRVNSWQRFRAAAAAGYDSADGTVLRFDPKRPVHEWSGRALANPGLWKGSRMSEAETLLAVQLEQAGIPFEREYRFAPPRKWRADFAILYGPTFRSNDDIDVLVEIDGGGWVQGRHTRGSGFEKDAEKQSAAAILGYRVIRCTPAQVNDGRALSWIRQALGIEEAA
jgi:hypothetical protein